MKILWWSAAPWIPTGYGQQTKLFAKRIEALGHELAICAYRGMSDAVTTHEGTIPVLPRNNDVYCQDVIAEYAKRFSADATISLFDVWPLRTSELGRALPKWCPIVPIDTETLPRPMASRLRDDTHMPIAMSRHGQKAMHAADVECRYVPHGYDPAVYYPVSKKEARAKLGWPEDRFMVSMVASNYVGLGHPNRKCFSENLEAFVTLKKRHKDAFLYLHTYIRPIDALGGGTDLLPLVEYLGIEDSVWFPDQVGLRLGMPQDYLRNVYSASDVLLAASAGEGFGVPIIEAQACGCPVIVGDWSAMAELVGGGWKIDKSEAHRIWNPFESFWHLPHPAAIADRLERAYQSSRASRSTEALNFAKDYEAENIMAKYWVPLLTELSKEEGTGRAQEEKQL